MFLFLAKSILVVVLIFIGGAISDSIGSSWPMVAAVAITLIIAWTHKEESYD
jgi:hypothetical protein